MNHRDREARLIMEGLPRWKAVTEDPQSEWNGKSMEDIVRAIPDWYENNKGQTIDRPSTAQVMKFLELIGVTNRPSNVTVTVGIRAIYGRKYQQQPANRERTEAYKTVSELTVEELNKLDISGWSNKEIWDRAKVIFDGILLNFYSPDPITNEPHAYVAAGRGHSRTILKRVMADAGYVIGPLQQESRWDEILPVLIGPSVTLAQAIRSGYLDGFLDYWTNEHENYSISDAVVQYFNPKLIELGLDPIEGDDVKGFAGRLILRFRENEKTLNPQPQMGLAAKQRRDGSDDIGSFKDFHSKQHFSGGPQDPTSSYRKRGGGDANPAGKPSQRHPRFNP